jgi:predicted alpha/beta superfamily hydrolase
MHNLKSFITLLCFSICINTVYSQHPKVELPGTEVLKFKSAINNQDYVLYIQLPDSYSDTTKRYPVLYVLDGQWSFPYEAGTQGIQRGLYYDGFIPEMIVVGITWPGDYDNNRTRDFSPTPVTDIPNSGGAPKFLNVIKKEIIKLIDSGYRTDQNNNTLTGGSFGGLFTLYALFNEPALFNRYIVWGPGLDYDDGVIFKYEKTFAQKNHELNAKVFISTSEYEEQVNGSYFNKFIDQLRASKYKGLELESFITEKMGHVSEGPFAVSRGLQFVFSQPAIIVDTLLLDHYTGHYKLNEDSVTITRSGNSLYINFAGGKIRLYAKTNDSFYAKGLGGGTGPQFITDNKGKATGYNISFGNNTMFFKKLD